MEAFCVVLHPEETDAIKLNLHEVDWSVRAADQYIPHALSDQKGTPSYALA